MIGWFIPLDTCHLPRGQAIRSIFSYGNSPYRVSIPSGRTRTRNDSDQLGVAAAVILTPPPSSSSTPAPRTHSAARPLIPSQAQCPPPPTATCALPFPIPGPAPSPHHGPLAWRPLLVRCPPPPGAPTRRGALSHPGTASSPPTVAPSLTLGDRAPPTRRPWRSLR